MYMRIIQNNNTHESLLLLPLLSLLPLVVVVVVVVVVVFGTVVDVVATSQNYSAKIAFFPCHLLTKESLI